LSSQFLHVVKLISLNSHLLQLLTKPQYGDKEIGWQDLSGYFRRNQWKITLQDPKQIIASENNALTLWHIAR